MTQKTAQIIFVIFNLIAILAIAYSAYDFISVSDAVEKREDVVPFDSGTYYLLLMSLFWVLSIIQYAGLKNKQASLLKYGNQISVGWFLFMLLLANLIPNYLSNKLEDAGYIKCVDPQEISRVAKGESNLYIKGSCQ